MDKTLTKAFVAMKTKNDAHNVYRGNLFRHPYTGVVGEVIETKTERCPDTFCQIIWLKLQDPETGEPLGNQFAIPLDIF